MKTFPRPAGKATHVIVTTYQLPRKNAMPHDADAWPNAPDGNVWYSDFGSPYIGELDPKTGKVTDHELPVLKPDEPKGTFNIQLDPEGNVWVGMMFQAGIAKLDRKTRKVTAYEMPKEWQTNRSQPPQVMPNRLDVDGNVWTRSADTGNTFRVNAGTGKWENLGNPKDQNDQTLGDYGIVSDANNNLYAFDWRGTRVGRVDAKTGKLTSWSTAFAHSRPRRGVLDGQGRVWFAEFGANGVGMFDPKTERIREWRLPLDWSMPYDAVPAKSGDVWAGSMMNDRATRLNTATGEAIDYLLPDPTCTRHVSFSDANNAFWTSGVHSGTIVRVEPLD